MVFLPITLFMAYYILLFKVFFITLRNPDAEKLYQKKEEAHFAGDSTFEQ
jgi:hypothetical protein